MDGEPERENIGAGPLWPALLVPLLGLALAACGAVLAGEGHGRPVGGPDAGRLIGLVAATAGCAVVLGWVLAALLAALAVLAGHHRWGRLAAWCGRCSPVLLRRAAATALGLQLVAAPAAIAGEAPSPFWSAVREAPAPTTDARPPAPDPVAAPGNGPAPVPVPAPPARDDPCAPRAGSSVSERTTDGAVTVVRGDTLWSLTAAQLGPGATDEQIARAWPRWYERNRHVLVDGPHRLLPGQRLVVPDTGDG